MGQNAETTKDKIQYHVRKLVALTGASAVLLTFGKDKDITESAGMTVQHFEGGNGPTDPPPQDPPPGGS